MFLDYYTYKRIIASIDFKHRGKGHNRQPHNKERMNKIKAKIRGRRK